MALVLGIDTSNYTTSCALYNTEDGSIIQKKQLLPVKSGECGIRQSDAVFHHTKQLPVLMEELFKECNDTPDAISVSTTPRRCEGSYMPCFTVGEGVARSLAAAMGVPLYTNSHQEGHIAAALYSAGKLDLIGERFLAFHVSGGTTEGIIVTADKSSIISCEIAAKTSDLNAGQLIDRTGVMLGLDFPCGKELEKLALEYKEKIKVKPSVKGTVCSLSGFQNKLQDIYKSSDNKCETAAYTLAYVEATIAKMTENCFDEYGVMPVVFAGGVMSNKLMRERLSEGCEAYFAEPAFSADNAAGIALLCRDKFSHRGLLLPFHGKDPSVVSLCAP